LPIASSASAAPTKTGTPCARRSRGLNVDVSTTIVTAIGRVAGPDDATKAARTVVAWLYGFVSMELAGSFRLGGDVDAAFDYGIDRILVGLDG
jgi:hypothetical protein